MQPLGSRCGKDVLSIFCMYHLEACTLQWKAQMVTHSGASIGNEQQQLSVWWERTVLLLSLHQPPYSTSHGPKASWVSRYKNAFSQSTKFTPEIYCHFLHILLVPFSSDRKIKAVHLLIFLFLFPHGAWAYNKKQWKLCICLHWREIRGKWKPEGSCGHYAKICAKRGTCTVVQSWPNVCI